MIIDLILPDNYCSFYRNLKEQMEKAVGRKVSDDEFASGIVTGWLHQVGNLQHPSKEKGYPQ